MAMNWQLQTALDNATKRRNEMKRLEEHYAELPYSAHCETWFHWLYLDAQSDVRIAMANIRENLRRY